MYKSRIDSSPTPRCYQASVIENVRVYKETGKTSRVELECLDTASSMVSRAEDNKRGVPSWPIVAD